MASKSISVVLTVPTDPPLRRFDEPVSTTKENQLEIVPNGFEKSSV